MNLPVIVPLFFGLRGWQLIIVLLLIILLFGAKRIPTLMKSLGKSVHSFKQGMAEAEAEIKKPVKVNDDEKRERKDEKQDEHRAKDLSE